jgi:predicted ATPase
MARRRDLRSRARRCRSPDRSRSSASSRARRGRAGAQFVVATRSPILLACPDARIYELDDEGIALRAYDDLDAVRLTRGFLEAPERHLRAALGDASG